MKEEQLLLDSIRDYAIYMLDTGSIAENLGGTITATSNPGEGAVFTLIIPS
ncbi:MAG: hypothetical protein ACR2GN_06500 [Bacteroidia bacterium]